MRLLLAVALILLFAWLYTAQTSGDARGYPCVATSLSQAAASLLLSPLSLYSLLSSTLLRLLLWAPALVADALLQSVLLLLAGPWCVAAAGLSLLLAGLHVAVYLLHVAVGVAAAAALLLARPRTAAGRRVARDGRRKPESRGTGAGWLTFGRRVVLQG